MTELNRLIDQCAIERDLCDTAPTLEALLYWWQKWMRTAYQIDRLIARLGTTGACHVNEAWIGNISEVD